MSPDVSGTETPGGCWGVGGSGRPWGGAPSGGSSPGGGAPLGGGALTLVSARLCECHSRNASPPAKFVVLNKCLACSI